LLLGEPSLVDCCDKAIHLSARGVGLEARGRSRRCCFRSGRVAHRAGVTGIRPCPRTAFSRLPDHVVAPLLRALMCITRRPESRLNLRKVVPPRMRRNAEDYRVHKQDDVVGSIWGDPNPATLEAKIARWIWSIDTTRGGTDMEHGWWSGGRSRTREEAVNAFRNAWDGHQPMKKAGR
jgi:hypothetical protein